MYKICCQKVQCFLEVYRRPLFSFLITQKIFPVSVEINRFVVIKFLCVKSQFKWLICTEHSYRTRNEWVGVFHERVRVLFFSGMWGSVLGSPWRLQVPYVIPGPGVPRHMYMSSKREESISRIRVREIPHDKDDIYTL